MLQRWPAVGNTVSDYPARDTNLRPPTPETKALLLDQRWAFLPDFLLFMYV